MLLWLLMIFLKSYSQPGSLDSTFGNNGKVITSISNWSDYGESVNILPDGCIITAGAYEKTQSVFNMCILKYKADGTLDNTFGVGGIVTDNISSKNWIFSTVIQPDGKIIAVGYTGSGISKEILLLRYNANGTLDNSFGVGGVVTTHVNISQEGFSLALQPDWKIVVSAHIYNGTDFDVALARYNPNGTLDNSFGTGGVVVFPNITGYELVSSMKIQPDGKIVLVGRTYTTFAESKCFILRCDANGLLDNAFGTGGITTTSVGNVPGYGVFNDVAIQSDGKIVAVGYSIEGIGGGLYENKHLMVRYNSNGLLDNSFGINGVVLTNNVFGGTAGITNGVTIQPNGKILTAGYTGMPSPFFSSYFTVNRYNSDGSLDTSFDTDGLVTTNVSGNETNAAYSIKLQPDGKIVAVGITDGLNSRKDIALVRFNSGLNLAPVLNLGNDTIFCSNQIPFTLNAENTGSAYLWSTGEITQSIFAYSSGTYWVSVIGANGFPSSDTITVTFKPTPYVNLGNDSMICAGGSIILLPDASFDTYLWSDGSTLQSLNINNPGIYSVVVSKDGCEARDEIIIKECDSEIWFPNAFTPDGDGVNDLFYPVYTNVDKKTLTVFNRWGGKVFEGSGGAAIWDGKHLGELCPEGIYSYIFDYEEKSGSKRVSKQLHGSITLLK